MLSVGLTSLLSVVGVPEAARRESSKAVQEHNQWLENQKSPMIKLIEAQEKEARANRIFDDAKKQYDRSLSELNAISAEVTRLKALVSTL